MKRYILIAVLVVFTLACVYGCTYNYYPDSYGKGKDGKQVTVVGPQNPTATPQPPVIINSPPANFPYPPPSPPQIIPFPMGGGNQSPSVVYPPNYPPNYPPALQNK